MSSRKLAKMTKRTVRASLHINTAVDTTYTHETESFDISCTHPMLSCPAEVIFETMILACVIDGAVGKRELDLLSRTRQTIEPDDAWPDALSDEDKKLHEDVLDSLIEERCHAWCQCIRDGGSHFVRTPFSSFVLTIPQFIALCKVLSLYRFDQRYSAVHIRAGNKRRRTASVDGGDHGLSRMGQG